MCRNDGILPSSGSAAPDLLVPSFDSDQRKSALLPATFNLVATIVGGGVLSLPLAFQKCGIGLATLLMIMAAVVTDFSLYLLCLCARQTGVGAYGEVGRRSFGKRLEWFISGLLFVFLLFVIVAYMVLIRDIWTPIVTLLFGLDQELRGDIVLLGALFLMGPFLIQRELHALRYNCYVGFVSITTLALALVHIAFVNRGMSDKDNLGFKKSDNNLVEDDDKILWGATDSLSDVLFAFPIITLSFLSHFNILPIQSALIRPTTSRIRVVTDGAVGACFVLMYLFGLAGYLSFGAATQGNILLNLSTFDNPLVFCGRVGCGVTILFAMPMMALPCRSSILELLDCWLERNRVALPIEHQAAREETPLLSIDRSLDHADSLEDRVHISKNPFIHYGSTFLIVLCCYLGAVAAPGVAIVWSLCGSSMAFLIAFILPAACYLRIQRKTQRSHRNRSMIAFSWILLFVSLGAAIACTIQTISRILRV